MNNPPFKVVCVDDSIKNPKCDRLTIGKVYTVKGQCPFYPHNWDIVELLYSSFDGAPQSYYKKHFAPIQSDYTDATTEILEKFKQTEETPDKIIIKETVQ